MAYKFWFYFLVMWNLSDPKQAEQALQYLYSLPSDEENSDEEPDFGAIEELNTLQCETTTSTSENNSTCTDLLLSDDEICDNVLSAEQYEETNTLANEVLEEFDNEEMEDTKHETWNENTDYFDKLKNTFSLVSHTVQNFSHQDREMNYFLNIFTENSIQNIVNETNLYASQNMPRRSNKYSEPKPSNNWENTSVDEIKAFFGLLIIMGIHKLPQLSNYWSSDPFIGVKSISQVMSSKRFKKLIENIHLNDNKTAVSKDEQGYDKLHKLRPLIDSLNQSFSSSYNHSSFLSVDESMIAFKGRSSMKQYMPMKPVKRGYKVWCIADSCTGYVYKFDIYTGKSDNVDRAKSLGEKVVIRLTASLKNKCCLVAFDNFFTTCSLMKTLGENKIYAVATVRPNRKDLPNIFKEKSNLKRGEFMYKTKGNIAAVKWMDNKPVHFLTNCFSPRDTTTVKRKNKDGSLVEISCPNLVKQYNKYMGGVDKFDQFLERYAIGRRSTKWWHRIMYYLVDMTIINSYVQMNINKRSQNKYGDQLSFRINLARQLIQGFTSRKRRNKPVVFLGNKRSIPPEVRLSGVGSHMPNLQKTYRRCRLCSTKANEKRTKYTCSSCEVPLCVHPCFKKFHGR